LNRLEKIGAIPSVDDWLLLREVRNTFSHDYPDDPELKAEIINKALELTTVLLDVLESVKRFVQPYL
jgi:hypothetical protein